MSHANFLWHLVELVRQARPAREGAGIKITAEAPIERIPVFLRVGANISVAAPSEA